jgi:hypothetical protein
VTTYHVEIPRAILEQHQRVTLAVNVMFINGVPFLVSISGGVNLVITYRSRGMSALNYSWEQKIKMNSSSKAELVGVDDSLGYILWARYFMQEQGFGMEASLVCQDNMSANLLETNGRASSSKRTKHIKVKYFLLKTWSNKGKLPSNIARLDKCGQTSILSLNRA